jgi:protoheme IX farnesyltransferase
MLSGEFMSVSDIKPPVLTVVSPRTWQEWLQIGMVLFKMRVVSLLLMAAVGGVFLGAGGWPGLNALALILVTGGMAAAGSSALNQYIERELDQQMTRTRKRPLPTGMLNQRWIPAIGVGLIVLPVVAVLPFNRALAFFLLLGAVVYVGIYTVWLKPRTLLNIVIGGAAGSAAVMSGGAAVGAWQNPGVIVLALIVFLWTPCHFWSLAILYRDDYARAGFPMLPTRMSSRNAAWWVLLHTVPTALGAILLAVLPTLGWLYLVPVALISADMVRRNITLIRQPSPANARAFFISSNIYLTILLLAICVDTTLRGWMA